MATWQSRWGAALIHRLDKGFESVWDSTSLNWMVSIISPHCSQQNLVMEVNDAVSPFYIFWICPRRPCSLLINTAAWSVFISAWFPVQGLWSLKNCQSFETCPHLKFFFLQYKKCARQLAVPFYFNIYSYLYLYTHTTWQRHIIILIT